MRIESTTFIPLLNRSIPADGVRVQIQDVKNVFAPISTVNQDQREAHSAGLRYGLEEAGRLNLLSDDFANSLAAKKITTMGQVLQAGRTLIDRKELSDDGTEKLVGKLALRLQKVGKRLDKVSINRSTGCYIARENRGSSKLIKALEAAEKTTVDAAKGLNGDRLLAAVAANHVFPAVVRRIAVNFPELFRGGIWRGADSFDVDDFLQREQMDSLYAMTRHGFQSDNFLGLQQALNNFVKVPAMVVDRA